MDGDEDDGLFISAFGNRNAKPFREKTSKKHGFLFFTWYVVYVDVHVEVGTRYKSYEY